MCGWGIVVKGLVEAAQQGRRHLSFPPFAGYERIRAIRCSQ